VRFSANLAFVLLAASAGFLTEPASAQETAEVAAVDEAVVIEDGRQVSIEYTLTLDDGTVVEIRTGEGAVEYQQGEGPLREALQGALVGLSPGDSKKITLTVEQGFGPVDSELFKTVPAEQLPETSRVVGAEGHFTSPDGLKFYARVYEVKGDEIVIDLNHPLAGKVLHFDVRVVSVE